MKTLTVTFPQIFARLAGLLIAAAVCVSASAQYYEDRALMYAVKRGDSRTVDIRLSGGANPNILDKDNIPALAWAIMRGHTEIAEMLQDAGADVNLGEVPPLMWAALHGNLEVVNALITAGADVNVEVAASEAANTPLMAAAVAWHLEVVNALIAAGADVNVTDESGRTVLMFATIKANLELVNTAIAAGADVNAADDEVGAALMMAVLNQNLEIVNTLIAAGADVNASNADFSQGITPLMVAVIEGDLGVVNALIDAGADVNAKHREGATVFEMAVKRGSLEIMEALVDAGADTGVFGDALSEFAESLPGDLTGDENDKELQDAFSKALPGYLIEHGIDINLLMFELPAFVEEALKAEGIDISETLKGGMSQLMFAAAGGNLAGVNAFIEAGADVNLKNKNGDTALSIAKERGHAEIVQALEAAGAK